MATKTEEFTTGNGTTTLPFTTQYLNETDIKVRIDGGNPLTFTNSASPSTGQYHIPNNGTSIKFGDTWTSSNVVHIYSETNIATPQVTFHPGSSIRASDLNAIEQLIRH